jgi:predicted MPP superfamily phosphohydrolase
MAINKPPVQIAAALTRKKYIFLVITATSVLLPLILMVSLAVTHGTLDNILYGALKWPYLLFILIIVSIIVLACISLTKFSSRPGHGTGLILAALTLSLVSITFTVAISAYVSIPRLVRSGDTAPQLVISNLNGESQSTISLLFWTEKPTQNSVEYGTADGLSGQILNEDTPSNKHWFYLAGLEPGGKYYYSLNGGKHFEFNIPSWEDENLRFAAAGDTHFGSPWSRNDLTMSMLEEIKNPVNNYSMFFIMGDCVDMGFIDRQWKRAFKQISSCSDTVPVCYLTGNHDTLCGGVNLYRDYLCPACNTKDNQGCYNRGCLWKRIDVGQVHFIILDVEWGTELFTPAQHQWLLEQLKSIPREDWCIVMSHTFYYCSGGYIDGWEWYDNQQTIAEMTPLFEQYDVDLVLSAHKHQAELLQKNGVTYLVVGCFGGQPDPERTYTSPASIWYKQGAYAFADITVKENEAYINFRDADNNSLFEYIVER